jgi:hypothetical protein
VIGNVTGGFDYDRGTGQGHDIGQQIWWHLPPTEIGVAITA